MADNFNMKQFLVENKLGAYSKLKENKFYSRDYVAQKYGDKAKEIEDNIHDEEDNNPNIWDLYTSLETADEVDNFVKGYMNEGKNFDLDAAFKASPMSHSYEDVLDIFESYEDESILNDFKAKFPEGKDISRKDYGDFAMSMIDDMSEVAYIKANWISLTDDDVYTKAGLAEEKEKLAKEDYAGAEEEKMMDFLAEENVEEVSQNAFMIVDRIEEIVANLTRNISTNSNIPTQEKVGLMRALEELNDFVEDLGADLEMRETKKPVEEDKYDIDAQSFGGAIKSDNPEGDALVLRFLKGIAKKFDYPVGQAALFVKERIKKLGY